MKFLALIYADESATSTPRRRTIAAIMEAHDAFGAGRRGGRVRRRRGLERSATATTCACATASACSPTARSPRRRSSSAASTLLECKDLDEALDVGGSDPGGPVRRGRGAPGHRLRRLEGAMNGAEAAA